MSSQWKPDWQPDIWTPEAALRLSRYLHRPDYVIPPGLGTKEAACSMAAINLAITGELTDEVPACMSRVIGDWIVIMQDSMPSSMRNSGGWKALLPLAAGTGREDERERMDIVMDWMWSYVLPQFQYVADSSGYGSSWREMCTGRVVALAAVLSMQKAAVAVVVAAVQGSLAPEVADMRDAAAMAAVKARDATLSKELADQLWGVVSPGGAVSAAADAAIAAAEAAAIIVTHRDDAEAAMADMDPVALLRRLIYLGGDDDRADA